MKVSLTPHQQKFIAKKLKFGGYASHGQIMREGLRSPLKKYTKNRFAKLLNPVPNPSLTNALRPAKP